MYSIYFKQIVRSTPLKTRVITGISSIALLLLILVFFNSIFFNIVCMVTMLIAFSEIIKVFLSEKDVSFFVFIGILPITIFSFLFYNRGYGNLLSWIIIIEIFYYMFLQVFFFKKLLFSQLSATLLFGTYILFGFYSASSINTLYPYTVYKFDGLFYLLLALVITWGTDIFAYFIGVTFGKHKMTPELSPKKSLEGAIGGFISGILLGELLLLAYSFTLKHILSDYSAIIAPNSFIKLFLISACISLISMAGDLFASTIKRQNNIKDYGNILPGHGGIVDRFDSVIAIMPFFVMLINFTFLIVR